MVFDSEVRLFSLGFLLLSSDCAIEVEEKRIASLEWPPGLVETAGRLHGRKILPGSFKSPLMSIESESTVLELPRTGSKTVGRGGSEETDKPEPARGAKRFITPTNAIASLARDTKILSSMKTS